MYIEERDTALTVGTQGIKKTIAGEFNSMKKPITRKQADQIFLEAMGVLGVRKWRKYLMYYAVRLGGWLAWRAKR